MRNTSGRNHMTFIRDSDGAAIGSIFQNGFGGTTFSTTSDYRLKENVESLENALDKIRKVEPKTYNFIGNENRTDGFLAHELQEVCPYAVKGVKDEVDKEGKAIMMEVDYSKVTPLLWKGMIELKERLEKLEKCGIRM